MSAISEKPSLLRSAGQALAPQWRMKLVPAELSTTVLKPSQSGSLAGTDQGGRFWARFGQFGQLSAVLSTLSPSKSLLQGVQPKRKELVNVDTSEMSQKLSCWSAAA